MLKSLNWSPKRAKAADWIRNSAKQEHAREQQLLDRRLAKLERLAELIDDGKIQEARRMFQRAYGSIDIPGFIADILYPNVDSHIYRE